MDEKTKFNIKTFLYYIVFEPWTLKFILPNWRTLVWILIVFSTFLRNEILLFSSVISGAILHGIYEYKSGKHIHWYRQRKYHQRNEALKKIKERRKREKFHPENY